jgi:hypothetical protein
MRRLAALSRLALALAALAAIVPALALAQASPATQRVPGRYGYGYGPQRDTWYIGFGLGTGIGSASFGGQRIDLRDLNAPLSATPLVLQFEVGATLRPDLLLGLDLRVLRTFSSGTLVFTDGSTASDPAVQVTQGLAMITWFPRRHGLFLRGGAGLASYSEDARFNGVRSEGSITGLGLLGGVGYAFWLGQHFNLTLNLDLTAQAYGDQANFPTSTRYGDLYLGFTWY